MNPQLVPSHVAIALPGAEHGEHEMVPQLDTLLLLEQLPEQLWKPVLQVNPQLVPSQVVVAFGREPHVVQSVPQLETELLLTHAPLQL